MFRRSFLAIAVLAAVLLGTSTAVPGEKPKWKPIKVSWHGQSFFIVETSNGTKLAFDPHTIPEYGRPAGLKADIVMISHNHDDHNRVEALENYQDKKIKIIYGLKTKGLRADWNPVDETIGNVKIRTIGVYHDDVEGLRSGKVSAFIVEVDGWRICHLGDLGHQLSAAQLKAIGPVDVLMIPVGGIYTLNGSEAKKVVEQIKPKEYIFPMHVGTKVYDDLLPATEFLDGQPRERVANSDDNAAILNRDASRPRPLIVMLNFEPKVEKKKK